MPAYCGGRCTSRRYTFKTLQAGKRFQRQTEKFDGGNGNGIQSETSLRQQESMDGSVVQFNSKKRNINLIFRSDSVGRPLKRAREAHRSVMKARAYASFQLNEMKNSSKIPTPNILGKALQSNVVETSCSSVSSSGSHDVHDFIPSNLHTLPRPGVDMSDEDAESCSPYTDEKDNGNSLVEHTTDVHMLEILAYRSVLKALRACGPLNWQREILLTDLRLSLHISNDEHRFELANVCSGQDL